MLVEAQLNHHRRGHWSLQWQCPDRNVWRVEHFRTEQDARDFMRFRTGVHEYKIKKNNNAGRYAQIGYWYGN